MGLSFVSKRSEGQNVNGNVYIKVHSVCTDFPALVMDTSVWDPLTIVIFLIIIIIFFFLDKEYVFLYYIKNSIIFVNIVS